jgi:hypothetical protein
MRQEVHHIMMPYGTRQISLVQVFWSCCIKFIQHHMISLVKVFIWRSLFKGRLKLSDYIRWPRGCHEKHLQSFPN